LDDPKIFDLMTEHGSLGYLVFFGILEIYAREFKTDSGWMLKTSIGYLKSKLRVYHANRLSILLQSLEHLCRWSVNLSGDRVEIYIPKFRELLDETTIKKLRAKEQNSGTIQEGVGSKDLDGDRDGDREKEREERKRPACPVAQIVEDYNTICVKSPRVRKITPTLTNAISTRWRSDTDFQSRAWFIDFFGKVSSIPGLVGEGGGNRPFRPGLSKLMEARIFDRIINGEYDDWHKQGGTGSRRMDKNVRAGQEFINGE
jgi:hypothetical protein